MILIKGKLYDVLKFLALVFLPALGALYFTLAGLWGLPSAEEVVGTVVAIDAFLGVVLQLSSTAYKKSDARYDGDLVIEEQGDRRVFNLELKDDPEYELANKDQILFKVKKTKK